MFWVYILRCADASYYTGHSDNLELRFAEHQAGKRPGYTATRLPVELVFQQALGTREEAQAAEYQVKHWSRRKKEALMAGNWCELSLLARNGRERAKTDSRVGEAAET